MAQVYYDRKTINHYVAQPEARYGNHGCVSFTDISRVRNPVQRFISTDTEQETMRVLAMLKNSGTTIDLRFLPNVENLETPIF